MFQYLGRNGYGLVLYASTFIGRKKWVEHIAKQKQVLRGKTDIYTRQILMANFFDITNRVNCVTPLDGGRKLLYGTDNGIWISDTRASASGGRVTSTPQKVIHMASVVQIDVMEEYNILLALSGKTLYTWPLDCLETLDAQGNERRARKVLSRINFTKLEFALEEYWCAQLITDQARRTSKYLNQPIRFREESGHNYVSCYKGRAKAFGCLRSGLCRRRSSLFRFDEYVVCWERQRV